MVQILLMLEVLFTQYSKVEDLGPVVQSIVNLPSLLGGQLIKCFMTLYPNTLIFFVDKMSEAFAVQKLLTFFQQKYLRFSDINV